MNRRRRGAADGQSGFTLVEVLVALTIAGIAMFGLMRLMNTAIGGSDRAALASTALLVAESRLAAVGVEAPLRVGQTSGATPDGFAWTVDIAPHAGLDGDLADRIPVRAFTVAVSVTPPGGAPIALRTLRLTPRETTSDRP